MRMRIIHALACATVLAFALDVGSAAEDRQQEDDKSGPVGHKGMKYVWSRDGAVRPFAQYDDVDALGRSFWMLGNTPPEPDWVPMPGEDWRATFWRQYVNALSNEVSKVEAEVVQPQELRRLQTVAAAAYWREIKTVRAMAERDAGVARAVERLSQVEDAMRQRYGSVSNGIWRMHTEPPPEEWKNYSEARATVVSRLGDAGLLPACQPIFEESLKARLEFRSALAQVRKLKVVRGLLREMCGELASGSFPQSYDVAVGTTGPDGRSVSLGMRPHPIETKADALFLTRIRTGEHRRQVDGGRPASAPSEFDDIPAPSCLMLPFEGTSPSGP